jgi:hypothetical protein
MMGRRSSTVSGGRLGCADDLAVDFPHDVERRTEHVGVGAERDRVEDGNGRAAQD